MWISHYATAFLAFAAAADALRFDLIAKQKNTVVPRCIRNYVGRDTLVVVTTTVSGKKNDGQRVDIHVRFILLAVLAGSADGVRRRLRIRLGMSTGRART